MSRAGRGSTRDRGGGTSPSRSGRGPQSGSCGRRPDAARTAPRRERRAGIRPGARRRRRTPPRRRAPSRACRRRRTGATGRASLGVRSRIEPARATVAGARSTRRAVIRARPPGSRSATSASNGTTIAARHASRSAASRSSAAATSSGPSKPTPPAPTSSGWPPLRRKSAGRPQESASSNAFEQGSSRLGAM